MIEPIALPRGAALLAENAAGARSFAVGFWFPIGSRHEKKSERGFVHFVEHLLFKGTTSRSSLGIAREVDRVGGWINAFTERDVVCLQCVVPASHWKLALDVLFDMAFRSTFPPEEVERERSVIVSEILAATDDPEEASHDAFMERIWPGDPLGLKIAGESQDAQRASRSDLIDFYQRNITPNRLLVTMAGPTDGKNESSFLGDLLSALPMPDSELSFPSGQDKTPTFFSTVDFVSSPIEQTFLYEAVQLNPPFAPSDYYSLAVLNGALGESMSSRLFQGLREREGLCYSVYSAISMSRSECLWFAQASSAPAAFPRLVTALDREIDALCETTSISPRCGDARGIGWKSMGRLSGEEISESVSRLAGSFELALDDVEFRMKRLARQRLYADEVLAAEETKAKILSVDAHAVAFAAERLFSGRERARFGYGRKARGSFEALGLAAMPEAKSPRNRSRG